MSEPLWHFCLDMGGTKTAGALFAPDGTEVARAMAGPGAVSLGVDVAEAALRAIWAGVGNGKAASGVTVAIGLAGIGLRDRVAALAARLQDFARVTIVGDGYGMVLAATGGGPGALIAVGTGVAAMRVMPDGRFRSLSGWGFPAGDLGSGAWIGLQAVAALTRRIDRAESGLSMGDVLAGTLIWALGGGAGAIMDRNTGGRPRDFAALAPLVFTAAEEGDPAAHAILGAAAGEICAVGRALWDDGPGAVLLAGGLATPLAPWVRDAGPERAWTVVQADPLAGLSLLARGLAPEERLVPRPGLAASDY
jgi:glucosamine kinase